MSDERERELLGVETTSETVAESSKTYRRNIQDESLEGFSEYLKFFYLVTDYMGITSPDQRIEKKIKRSDQSCIKQRVLISSYDRKIKQQEVLVSDKEKELRDCMIYFNKKNKQIEDAMLQAESLEEERQELDQRLSKNPEDQETLERAMKLEHDLISSNQDVRRYKRERNEFASKIIETDSFIKEAENVLVSIQVYSSALHNNYLKSRVERMRLAPLVGIGNKPTETIDLIVEDQKVAEETGRLADSMTMWMSEITGQIADLRISPRERGSMYSDMNQRNDLSNKDLVKMAEEVIADKSKGKYVK